MTNDATASGLSKADVLAEAERWMNEGRALAIATIIDGSGGACFLAGHRMIVDAHASVFGKLGISKIDAGAIEAGVLAQASTVIASGEPCMLDIELTDGHARLYVERLG